MDVKNNQTKKPESQRTRQSGRDLKRMATAAEMYYEGRYSQKEIGKALKCSPMEVSRLLKEAREHGIVKFQIYHPEKSLREALIERFSLRDARVSHIFPDAEQTREALALEAARLFDEFVANSHSGSGITVGVSGGRTIHKMVDLLKPLPRQIDIYPLTGIWRDLQINYVDSGVLVHSLWLKCKDAARAFWFPIEPLDHFKRAKTVREQRKRYLQNPQIKEIYEAANNVDVAFLGVGPVREHSSTIRQLKSIEITYETLKEKSAVGIAAGVWYNRKAKPVIPDYFLSVPLTTFQKLASDITKRVVIVAGGDEKIEAIRVLLENKMCNVIVTDNRTAALLLQ